MRGSALSCWSPYREERARPRSIEFAKDVYVLDSIAVVVRDLERSETVELKVVGEDDLPGATRIPDSGGGRNALR